MPKKETLEIQNFIKNLGTKMGFETALEERIHENDIYAPIYDAVWYLDLTKYFNFDSISYLFEYDLKWLNRCKRIPLKRIYIGEDLKLQSILIFMQVTEMYFLWIKYI